jgi:hypothetical protein
MLTLPGTGKEKKECDTAKLIREVFPYPLGESTSSAKIVHVVIRMLCNAGNSSKKVVTRSFSHLKVVPELLSRDISSGPPQARTFVECNTPSTSLSAAP